MKSKFTETVHITMFSAEESKRVKELLEANGYDVKIALLSFDEAYLIKEKEVNAAL